MTDGDGLRLREATRSDADLLLRWANDPDVRDRSISTDPIGWDEHLSWLDRVLEDPDRILYILETEDGTPAGQIRFDDEDGEVIVSVTVASDHRGRGLGRRLIRLGTTAAADALDARCFVALIRPDNSASVRAFEAADFHPTGHETRRGVELLRLEHQLPESEDTGEGADRR